MRIILLGAPGAGKGTQAEILSKRLSLPVISTGNILREAMKNETELGRRAKAYVDAGALVPDDVIVGIIKDRLERPDCEDGFILDGVPRTIAQADALGDLGVELDKVISMEIGDDVIVRRLSGRRVCLNCGASYHVEHNAPKDEGVCDGCGERLHIRDDDRAETVGERLRIYHEQTEPLKHYYKKLGRLRSVNGHAQIEEITREILAALEA